MHTDCGTENCLVRELQRRLHTNHEDDLLVEQISYLTGVSTADQHTESWWGILWKESLEYWIQPLGELRDEGGFDGGLLDKAILQLCVGKNSGMMIGC